MTLEQESEVECLRALVQKLAREKNESDERLAHVMCMAEKLRARCEELERHMMRYRRHPSIAVGIEQKA